jgi:hypothetical protein
VTVSFTCVDPLSAIVGGCPASVVLGSQGVDQSVSRTATTKGGLSLSAGVSNIDIDLTNPTVTYTGGKATYDVDEQVSITCTAADALSGIASTTCANISGPAYSFGPGSHTFSASATDRAGNTATSSVTFSVVASYDGLCALAKELSSEKKVAVRLCDHLRQAEHENSLGKITKRNNHLDSFIEIVEEQRGRAFTAAEAATLIAFAQALKQS